METGNSSNNRNQEGHENQQIQGKKAPKQSKEPLKVKYISSPVMVNAKNASEFKAIVQELTGKDPIDDHHHQRSLPENFSGNAPNATEFNYQLPGNDGVRNAPNASYEFDGQAYRSNSGAIEVEDDVFWKLPESLSRYDFPFG
ncbi:OLC1v1026473C1 [Oldenlandia corymbosa var. corymbosa]|uniref:OLC1v1026473C1 n=1 Tax=Oldenlandia corymbosa var. corymbosa TaxID=529605 RepID=A0AAV1CA51_OLDCO|nr:OLC1v1026473C1 [Oldenlandia corymbosa var. corymbosa]